MQRIAVYLVFIFGLASFMTAAADIQPGAITIITAPYSPQLTQLQLVCGVPQQAYPDQCKNSVGATIAAAGTSFDLATIQSAFYPTNPKCPIAAVNCTLQGTLSGQAISIVDMTLNQLGKWSDGGAGLAWGVQLSNIQPHQGSNALVTSNSSNPIQQGSRYWTITLLSAVDGRLAFTGNLATMPAKLTCDGGKVFTSQFDSTAQENFFSFNDMHGGGDPAAPVSLTNCNLLDSSTTSPIYANIPNINNILSTPLAVGGLNEWVAEIPTLNNGTANYIVSGLQGTKAAQNNPNAFSHWLMQATPITNGSLIFSGNITGVTQALYLTCTALAPIKLSGYKIDMAALHGSDTSALIEKDYPTCTLGTDPSQPTQTTYAVFGLTGLQGGYHAAAGSAPMWGATASNIQEGNEPAILPDGVAITNTCDVTDPSRCNQVTINFGNTLSGVVIIHGVSITSLPTLTCNNNVYHFTPTGGDASSIQFDLKAIHTAASSDPSQSVDFNCEVFDDGGTVRLGDLTLNALNGVRTETGASGQAMWSTQMTTAGDLTLDATQPANRHCDQTGTYCDDWSATYNG